MIISTCSECGERFRILMIQSQNEGAKCPTCGTVNHRSVQQALQPPPQVEENYVAKPE